MVVYMPFDYMQYFESAHVDYSCTASVQTTFGYDKARLQPHVQSTPKLTRMDRKGDFHDNSG